VLKQRITELLAENMRLRQRDRVRRPVGVSLHE
jgi:hypothetical protein